MFDLFVNGKLFIYTITITKFPFPIEDLSQNRRKKPVRGNFSFSEMSTRNLYFYLKKSPQNLWFPIPFEKHLTTYIHNETKIAVAVIALCCNLQLD